MLAPPRPNKLVNKFAARMRISPVTVKITKLERSRRVTVPARIIVAVAYLRRVNALEVCNERPLGSHKSVD